MRTVLRARPFKALATSVYVYTTKERTRIPVRFGKLDSLELYGKQLRMSNVTASASVVLYWSLQSLYGPSMTSSDAICIGLWRNNHTHYIMQRRHNGQEYSITDCEKMRLCIYAHVVNPFVTVEVFPVIIVTVGIIQLLLDVESLKYPEVET